MMDASNRLRRQDWLTVDTVSLVLALCSLVVVLELNLVVPLLSGLLVHLVIRSALPFLGRLGLPHHVATIIALLIAVAIVAFGVWMMVLALRPWLSNGPDSLVLLLGQVTDIVNDARTRLPEWIASRLPASADEIEAVVAKWLREHAAELRSWGQHFGLLFIKAIVAMVIGGLIAVRGERSGPDLGPLAAALRMRALVFANAFREVALSQIRISALNTALTGIYLFFVLPAFGIHLPLIKTMVAITFLAGLLPIVGNLISNTVIIIVSLSVSLPAALGSLVFLVLIHKLEYFVNARIVGSRVKARAWELLLAMLVLEAWHGGAGLVAAPIYYAYVKRELSDRKLV
jgi:predicted PurR-regulated permease PerM